MIRNLVRYLSLGTLIVLSIAMMASCADDDDAAGAGDEIRPITVTPTAVADFSLDVEEAQLVIEDGGIAEESFTNIVVQPVMLTFVNRNDETYTFVAGDLITETEIPAATEIRIGFTAPTAENLEGQLLDADGEVLDTTFTEITGPSGL